MKIVAIGGGDVGAGETLPMDRELVSLTRIAAPRLLFIPTASDDDVGYYEAVSSTYSRLGCELEALWLWSVDGTSAAARTKIEWADVIYVGGGNTKKMLARWRELGVDAMLVRHLQAGKPVGGVSAGAICWFRVGNSDWPQYEKIPGINTARLDCLGLVDLAVCPHTSGELFRLGEFTEMMRTIPGAGVGLDDGCAIQIDGDRYRILSSLPGAIAHRIEWIGDRVIRSDLPPHNEYRPIADLKNTARFDTPGAPKT